MLGQPAGDDRGGEERAGLVAARSMELFEGTGAAVVAVTLDSDGAVVLRRDEEPVRTHAQPAPASHAVGAGDAYLAAFTLATASGAGTPDAARLAQLAATTAICGPRTCVASRDNLLAALPGPEPGPAHRVLDAEDLVARLGAERARGGRIVFTNGCFDVLHAGHVGFLEQARTLGDVLVVAVNSDRSVRRLKGVDRPVNGEDDRTVVLTALSCVDYVVVFDADTPARLIERVRPDVYVKGGDYHADLLPEAELVGRLGGRVEILDYVPDRSTSAVIERIRSRAVHEAP
jgi:rfaE bifunctional protein nucleotidyltransferase chain/domain